MNNVIVYPTPEVMDLIKLLHPNAVIEPHGDSGNVSVSLPKTKTWEQTDFDCYEMAVKWNCTPEEAADRMKNKEWRFVEYDAIYGTERYMRD